MMIRIAVCEDEEVQAEYLKTLLDRWQELAGVSAAVDVYRSAEQFLFEAEEQKTYDIMLLDIQMGEMNGLDLARRVRERDKRVRIVFLTGVADYAIEGYEVGALRYLLKPVKEPVFFEILSSLSEEMRKEEPEYFMFEANGMHNRILLGEILQREDAMNVGMYVVILLAAVLFTAAAAVLVTVKIMSRKQEKRIGEYQDKVLKTQRDEVRNIYHTMRGWWHDYHNHMQTIKAYLSMQKIEETLVYLEQPIESCEKVPEEKCFLRIYIGIFQRHLYLSVANATAETHRRCPSELVSKKGGSHGFGLCRIDLVAEKYQEFLLSFRKLLLK